MPKQRKLKKMVRERMKATGDRYTTARMFILGQLAGKAFAQELIAKVDMDIPIVIFDAADDDDGAKP